MKRPGQERSMLQRQASGLKVRTHPDQRGGHRREWRELIGAVGAGGKCDFILNDRDRGPALP